MSFGPNCLCRFCLLRLRCQLVRDYTRRNRLFIGISLATASVPTANAHPKGRRVTGFVADTPRVSAFRRVRATHQMASPSGTWTTPASESSTAAQYAWTQRQQADQARPARGCARRRSGGCGPSPPDCSVATAATTMLWASIILPITPPVLLLATISTGLRPNCSAVIRCRLPNRALARGVGAGQRHAQPAEQRREERIEPAGVREGQAERGVGAAVVRGEGQRQHAGDRQQRPAHAEQRAAELAAEDRRRDPQPERPRAPPPGKCPCPWPKAS